MVLTTSHASASGPVPGADAVLRKRSLRGPLFALVGVALAVALPLPAEAGPSAAAPRLPDLGVAPLQHMLIEITAGGKTRLRFTTSIANIGKGPIEITTTRPRDGAEWKPAMQRIYRMDGSSYQVEIPKVRFAFAGGDLHGHWHATGAARYELRGIDSGKAVRMRVKRGFCFYDSNAYRLSLRGAPKKVAYPKDDCGKKHDLRIAMGISTGWRDDYYWRIPGQAMDITGLPSGKYRLLAKADPRNWFRESNERNNLTWVDLLIEPQSVKILGRSPSF